LFFLHSPLVENGPTGTQLFSRTTHNAIGRRNRLDVILADAKLVGSAFDSAGKIEPGAPLECMHTAHPTHEHVEPEFCPLQLFNLSSFLPTGPELPRGSSCSVGKRSEWTTTPLNGIKAASCVHIKQENESSTNLARRSPENAGENSSFFQVSHYQGEEPRDFDDIMGDGF
jgi:hypothetical protein